MVVLGSSTCCKHAEPYILLLGMDAVGFIQAWKSVYYAEKFVFTRPKAIINRIVLFPIAEYFYFIFKATRLDQINTGHFYSCLSLM